MRKHKLFGNKTNKGGPECVEKIFVRPVGDEISWCKSSHKQLLCKEAGIEGGKNGTFWESV